MANDDKRLGRGLGAIFGDDVSSVLEDIQHGTNDDFEGVKTSLLIKDIRTNPYQPRRHFDEEKLKELSLSIKEHGLFTPILVREHKGAYELIAGERRLRASKLAGFLEIPSIVVNFNDQEMMEIALIENVQREDLSVIEEAMAYQNMIDKLGFTQAEVAKRVSKSRSHITNLLRLLRLPQSVQESLAKEEITMGQARPLLSLEKESEMELLAKRIVSEKLNAREVEKIVREFYEKPQSIKKKTNRQKSSDVIYVENMIENKIQSRVNIDKSKIQIFYDGDEDLNRILEILGIIE